MQKAPIPKNEKKRLLSLHKLEEEKTKDEALLENIGDGVVAVNQNGEIMLMNRAAERMLGLSAKQMVGKSFLDAWNVLDEQENSVPGEKRAITLALKGETTITTTASPSFFYIRKDGTKFPVASTVTPVIVKRKVIGAVDVFRDITKEKEVDKMKTEFVSLVSHQLRTPLTIVSWYAEMILRGDVGSVTPEQKKYLEEIYRGNKRMTELINTLLDMSRLELGTSAVQLEPIQLKDVAESVLAELRTLIVAKKLTLDKSYDPSSPTISANPKLTRIIFQNLLGNAVKYASFNGKMRFSISIQGSNALIEIWNDGAHISKEAQPKIFTKFFRDNSVKEKYPDGNGLGLYIAKSIIEKSGGKIWFESEENKGTTFCVTLPLEYGKREVTKALA